MTESERILRDAFRTMDPHRAQEIREAYYEAVCGLRSLADLLEIEDARNPGPASDPLLSEHFYAINALDAMNKSELGKIL